MFWIVKGHLNASDDTIIGCYDSYFKRMWCNLQGQSVDDLGTGFEKNVQYYEESITRNTAKLNAMIEPLMMVFLAGMVLVFLLALYLPLFQLGEWI